MAETILITGATGNVGVEVVKALQSYQADIRVAARHVDSARAKLGNGIGYVRFDFERPETYAAAFHDVRRLFLVRPPHISDVSRHIAPAIRAAYDTGVEQIVFLSLLGVEKNRVVPHAKIEQAIQAAGVSWTFLRCSFFMQNLNTTHRDELRDASEIFVPAGFGKTSFIDVRDIGLIGAKALIEDGHGNKAYDLTGTEALTYDDVAAALSTALGRPIRYTNPSLLAFVTRWLARGTPLSFALVMAAIYTTARLGLAGYVADDVERLLGRKPITLAQYAEDYRSSWL